VQINWPSGITRYFGNVGSEQEASGWISKRRGQTERGVEGAKINRSWGSVSGRKVVADVVTGPAPEQQGKD
jgi:hypothetical protein